MNILLTTSAEPTHSPFSTIEKRFPLGIGFLIAVLEKAGHKVYFIDNYLKPTNFIEEGFLQKNHIDYVGIYANTICYRDTLRMFQGIQNLREKGRWRGKIIVGGPHTTVLPETIPEYVDYIVQGEGEEAMLKILENGRDRIVKMPRIKELNNLPRPAYHKFVNLPYHTKVGWFEEEPVFVMNTSRGCPFRCAFCSVGSIWGKQYTYFSAERIIEDIEYLIKGYGVKGIYFREDNFTLKQDRVVRFCELLLKKGIKIKWICETRVNSLTEDLVKLMFDSGCRAFYLGCESGSQRVLDFMKKDITVEQTKQVIKWCDKFGLKTMSSFVVGVPTETSEERDKTMKLISVINSTKAAGAYANIFVGIPKSELYNYTIENKLYEYIDDIGVVYLKGHDQMVDQFYEGNPKAKIPRERERLDEEIRMYEECNKLIQKGQELFQQGKYKKAIEKSRRALSLNSNKIKTVSIQYGMGSAYEKEEEWDEAKKNFEMIIKLAREIPFWGNRNRFRGGAHFHLGTIYTILGNRERAEEEFKACLRLIPDHKKAKSLLREARCQK